VVGQPLGHPGDVRDVHYRTVRASRRLNVRSRCSTPPFGVRGLYESREPGPTSGTDELPVDRQWLCGRIVEEAGEAVTFADTDGVIRLWNDAAEEIFGYTAEEAVGERLDIIVPEEFREAHWRGYDEALDASEVTSPPVTRTQVPALHASGDRIEIETSGARVVTDADR
jgi:PAS domain S-box-containing protein